MHPDATDPERPQLSEAATDDTVRDYGRRRFIQTAATATAFVWAAPTITGVGRASAFAQMSPPPTDPPPTDPPPTDPPPTDPPPTDTTPPDDTEVLPDVIERPPSGPADRMPPASETGGIRTDGHRGGSRPDAVGHERTTRVAASEAMRRGGDELPRTGFDTTRIATLGAAAAAAGGAILGASRRKSEGDGDPEEPAQPS